MKKVLFFIDILTGGGAAKVLCELVNHMDTETFDITVQSLWPADAKKLLAPHIHYRSVYPRHNKFYNARMRLEAALGLIYPLYIRDDYDIEIAYLECAPTKILAGSTNKKAKKIAWVHSDLEVMISGSIPQFAKRTAPQYAKFDQVVCVSEKALQSFRKLYGEKPESRVLHNVVNDAAILEKAKQPLSAPKRGLTVVSVGTLYAAKGYMRLLQVHKRLTQEGFAHDLWIVGKGEDREKMEDFIRENGLENSVKLMGFQENPYPFIAAADLLVCSSFYEGLSTFLTEGLILGKPIVTTDCSGMAELLGNSEYGLITANSQEGLYEGLKKLLTDDALRKSYAQKAAARAEKFTMAEILEQTEDFLLK